MRDISLVKILQRTGQAWKCLGPNREKPFKLNAADLDHRSVLRPGKAGLKRSCIYGAGYLMAVGRNGTR